MHSAVNTSWFITKISRFYIFSLDNLNLTEAEREKQVQDDVDRSHFVQELLLSMLSKTSSSAENKPLVLEKAVPVECALFSASASSSRSKLFSNDHSPSLSSVSGEKTDDSRESNRKTEEDANVNLSDYQQVEPVSCRFEHASIQMNGDSDEDRPPSPTPLQGHERLLQARVYTPGSVSVGGFSEAAAPMGNYGREDTGSGNITKHVH